MSLAILGRGGFEDSYLPVKGKSEWGMDTLTRKLEGSRSLLESFIATLQQGQIYQDYFLQAWESDDDPVKATITLNYKGLLTGGTPLPDIQSAIVSAIGRSQKSYLDQNDGKGITIRNEVIWRYFFTSPIPPFTQTDEQVALRPVYIVSAAAEYRYHAVESKYRYINIGKPYGPRYSFVDVPYTPFVEEARISASDGTTYGKSDLSRFNLEPDLDSRVVSWSSVNVIGTPYYECEDVVRLELVDPADV